MPNRLRLTDSISLLTLRFGSRIKRSLFKVLESVGLQPRETSIIATVSQFGAMSQRELSQLLEIDRSTMVTCIDSLQDLKLVERQAHPQDRRVALIALTARGEQAVRDAKRELDAFESELMAPLSKSEQASLREILGKLAKLTPE